ncbi:MAG: tetratricopeptide repeat protein [candidate division WOR-3 bacterium]|uniref:Tetratricopeptide repeat protein n=1 Tax=candidate division WOR-3 bacterium TaxID=2052148 RepID=A0A7C1NBY6_UNCW3|nr:tetratricopeptide repeat protein [candidate division WOR-3 bacterium]
MHCLLILSLLTTVSTIDTICNRAAYLLFNRHLNPHYLDSAYHLLAHARQLDPRHEQTLYLWSRIHTQLGEMEQDRERKVRLFERARAIAETLQQVNPDNPDGHMWWAVAQGRIGETRGVLNSLFMVPALKKAFHRVLELDPKYPTVYDALGVLYYELPPFAGGDLKQAERYLIKGLQLDPNYTVIRLDLARVYLKQGRRDAAREQLRLLLRTSKPTYPADFYLEDKPEAERLLRQLATGN